MCAACVSGGSSSEGGAAPHTLSPRGVSGTRISRSGSVQNPPGESRDQARFSGGAWRETVWSRARRSALFSPSAQGWRRRRLVPERITMLLSVRPPAAAAADDDEEELFWRTGAEQHASPANTPPPNMAPPRISPKRIRADEDSDSGMKSYLLNANSLAC